MERTSNHQEDQSAPERASLWSTFLPWFAVLCIALILSAIYLSAGQPEFALRNVFGGFLFLLLPVALIVLLPLAHIIRVRQWGPLAMSLFFLGSAAVIAIPIAIIFTIEIELAAYGTAQFHWEVMTAILPTILVITILCAAIAIPVALLLQKRQGTAFTIVLATAAAALAGGLIVLFQPSL